MSVNRAPDAQTATEPNHVYLQFSYWIVTEWVQPKFGFKSEAL